MRILKQLDLPQMPALLLPEPNQNAGEKLYKKEARSRVERSLKEAYPGLAESTVSLSLLPRRSQSLAHQATAIPVPVPTRAAFQEQRSALASLLRFSRQLRPSFQSVELPFQPDPNLPAHSLPFSLPQPSPLPSSSSPILPCDLRLILLIALRTTSTLVDLSHRCPSI